MGRPFNFNPGVMERARVRQWGLCAHCGDSLTDAWEEAHHVIPNQTGRPGDPADAFLRGVDNCAVLCDPCHIAAHGHGNYRTGAVAPADWYPYSHGRNGQAQHEKWRNLLAREWQRLCARKR